MVPVLWSAIVPLKGGLNVNACESWSHQMDSLNIQCDLKVCLQDAHRKQAK